MSAKKKNSIPKEVAKKVVQHTAYKAQAQGRRAEEDLRNTADGESTTEDYAHEKVEDSAKETAYAAGDFTFQATKLPYRAYRKALQKRQAEKAIIPEEASPTKVRNTAEATVPEATTPPRWIAPTSSSILSAKPGRCGASLIGAVWKMTFPWSPTPSSKARPVFYTTGCGGAIFFLAPGWQRAPPSSDRRPRREGFDPWAIRDVIAGKRSLLKLNAPAPAALRGVDLIVDIQEGRPSGKSAVYEWWAKVYNLKRMAAALQFIQEHQISKYDQFITEVEAASARFHTLMEKLRHTEADLAYRSPFDTHIFPEWRIINHCPFLGSPDLCLYHFSS